MYWNMLENDSFHRLRVIETSSASKIAHLNAFVTLRENHRILNFRTSRLVKEFLSWPLDRRFSVHMIQFGAGLGI